MRHRNTVGRLQVYDARWPGIVPLLERDFRDTEKEDYREELQKFMRVKPCPACNGQRLKPEMLAVTINGSNIAEVTAHVHRRRGGSGSTRWRSPSASRSSRTRW